LQKEEEAYLQEYMGYTN